MLYFTADARDGIVGASGGMCNSCCCQALNMRRGETNLITINYAPWSLPIGNPGIVGPFESAITWNTDGCNSGAIDGFGPPTANSINQGGPSNTNIVTNMTLYASPLLNNLTWSIEALQGPMHGTASITAGGLLTYRSQDGFGGYDVVWYRVTDPQGRYVIRSVTYTIPTAFGGPPGNFAALIPWIDASKIKVDANMQIVRFPLYMPPSCRPCDTYRLEIKQKAMDCDRTVYTHYSCFDLRCKDCN